MQRKVRTNQQQASTTAEFGTAIAQAQAREDKLRKENDQLKQKIDDYQDKLDEIADLASASPDGSEDVDPDELAEKLNSILDIASPDSVDDDTAA